MHKINAKIILIFIGLLFILPDTAHAAECIAAGDTVPSTGLPATRVTADGFDGGYGLAKTGSGDWRTDAADCQLNWFNMISGTICMVQTIVSHSMFRVYCSLFLNFIPIIDTILILYIMLYGVALLMGIGNHSLGDAGWRAVKLIIIYFFVTNADLFFVYIYQFFLEFLNSFSLLLMGVDSTGLPENPLAEGSANPDTNATVFAYMDRIFEAVLGYEKLIGLGGLAIMFLFFGPGMLISFMILIGILEMIRLIIWVLVSYLTAFIVMTFLLMFTPLFVAFLIFPKVTGPLFQGWFASVVSYTLQPLVILGFVFVIGQATNINGLMESIRNNLEAATGGGLVFIDCSMPFSNLSIKVPSILNPCHPLTWISIFGGPSPWPEWRVFLWTVFATVLAWLILNIVAASFLQKIPAFVASLTRWQNIRPPALTGRSMSQREMALRARDPGYTESDGMSGFTTISGSIMGAGRTAKASVNRAFMAADIGTRKASDWAYGASNTQKRADGTGPSRTARMNDTLKRSARKVVRKRGENDWLARNRKPIDSLENTLLNEQGILGERMRQKKREQEKQEEDAAMKKMKDAVAREEYYNRTGESSAAEYPDITSNVSEEPSPPTSSVSSEPKRDSSRKTREPSDMREDSFGQDRLSESIAASRTTAEQERAGIAQQQQQAEKDKALAEAERLHKEQQEKAAREEALKKVEEQALYEAESSLRGMYANVARGDFDTAEQAAKKVIADFPNSMFAKDLLNYIEQKKKDFES